MKIYLLLLAFLMAFSACKKDPDTPVNPNSNDNSTSFVCNVYKFDTVNNKWNDNTYQVINMKMDNNKSLTKYCTFEDCMGKNWGKNYFGLNWGAIVSLSQPDPSTGITMSSEYFYDAQGYLSHIDAKKNGTIEAKIKYSVNNGKILYDSVYDNANVLNYSTIYEYDNSRYIGKITRTWKNSGDKTVNQFVHDANGYIIKKIYTFNTNAPKTTNYNYNANGMLIKETDPEGYITNYIYDSAGRLSEMNYETNYFKKQSTYTYDSKGMPSELIDKFWSKIDGGKSFTKNVYKY